MTIYWTTFGLVLAMVSPIASDVGKSDGCAMTQPSGQERSRSADGESCIGKLKFYVTWQVEEGRDKESARIQIRQTSGDDAVDQDVISQVLPAVRRHAFAGLGIAMMSPETGGTNLVLTDSRSSYRALVDVIRIDDDVFAVVAKPTRTYMANLVRVESRKVILIVDGDDSTVIRGPQMESIVR